MSIFALQTKFTHDNHLRYTIGNREYGFRHTSIEPYRVNVGTIDNSYYQTTNYRQELRRTADLVYKDLGKDLVVFLSGGTDSEMVARNFVEIGIKPHCYTIRMENDYNADDVHEAMEVAKELGLKNTIIDFKIRNFVNSGEAIEFGNELQCTQVTYLMVYHSIRKLGLPAVMGGELLLKRNIMVDPSNWYYCFRENEDASAMRFSMKYNIPLVNEWFSYTPELMLSYLEEPFIKSLVTTKYNYKLTSASSKNILLKQLMPEIRVRKKTHGFEKLLAFNAESYRLLTGSQLQRLEPSLDGIEYSEVVNQLRGNNDN